jgi:S-adenosylmethionine hydrolase
MPQNPRPDAREIRRRLTEAERNIADLARDNAELTATFGKARQELQEGVKNFVTLETAKELATLRNSVDATIDGRLKLTWAVGALLLLVLGGVGYIAVIPSSVSAAIGSESKNEMNRLLDQAKRDAQQIQLFKESAKPQPSIVLQTDYGIGGPYMPALKGVILSKDPFARIDVVCTTIDAFDVLQASWYLWRSCRYYPAGTVFVCITNPGGITRDQIVLRTNNGQLFVGHDNGCFDMVAEQLGVSEVYKIGGIKYVPTRINDPFGGVDVFGPVAVDLAQGGALSEVGVKLPSYSPRLNRRQPDVQRDRLQGTVMDIDVFGNATVDLSQDQCELNGWRIGQTLKISVGKAIIDLSVPLRVTYGHASKGTPVALFYDGMLQLAVNEGHFKNAYGITRGDEVTIVR